MSEPRRATVSMGEVFLSDHDSDASSTTMTSETPLRRTTSTALCRGHVDFVREFSQFLCEEPLTVFPCLDDFDVTSRPITSTSGPSTDGLPDAPRLTRARTLNGAVDTTAAVRRGSLSSRPDEVAGRRFTLSFTSGDTTLHPAVEAARRALVSEVSVEAGESWPTSPGAARSPPTSPSLLSHQKMRTARSSELGSPGASSPTVCSQTAVRSKNEIMAQIFDALEIRSWTEVVAKVVEEENAVTDVAPWTLSPCASGSPSESSSPTSVMGSRRQSNGLSRARSLQERNDTRHRYSEMRPPRLELPRLQSDCLPMTAVTSSVTNSMHFGVGSGSVTMAS